MRTYCGPAFQVFKALEWAFKDLERGNLVPNVFGLGSVYCNSVALCLVTLARTTFVDVAIPLNQTLGRLTKTLFFTYLSWRHLSIDSMF